MILKTMRKKIYEPENSTEKIETYEINYIDKIKTINRIFNYEQLFTTLNLTFEDNSTLLFLLSERLDNAEKMLYDNVFLLNDKGETIERLV